MRRLTLLVAFVGLAGLGVADAIAGVDRQATPPGVAVFDGALDGDTIAGDFTQGAATGTFRLARRAAQPAAAAAPAGPPPPYHEQDVTFRNGAVTLAGTLTVPDGQGPFPALVMITGSGSQNRDEELFGFKPFKVLADGLARRGVATLRYDDRGVGGSSGADSDPTTEDFAGDALAGLALLAARPEIRRSAIGLLGHSEGAVVAAIAAARSTDVAFIVMMAGTAIRGDEVLRAQASDLARASGATPEQLTRILDAHRALIDAIRAGAGPDALTKIIRTLARAQIDAMPAAQRQAIGDPDAFIDRTMPAQLHAMQSRWMRFFVDFDPASVLEKVHCPVLALFGGKDMQVPPSTNRAPLEAALAKGGNRRVTLKVYPNANHLFIKAVTGSPAEYATLEKAFVPGFVDYVAGWITGATGRSAPGR